MEEVEPDCLCSEFNSNGPSVEEFKPFLNDPEPLRLFAR